MSKHWKHSFISIFPFNFIAWVGHSILHALQGFPHSILLCKKLNIPDNTRVNQLTEDQVLKIREFIDQNHKVEGDLRRQISVNIKRLVDLASYRGSRHKKKLPVRGQRTRTNAKNAKKCKYL